MHAHSGIPVAELMAKLGISYHVRVHTCMLFFVSYTRMVKHPVCDMHTDAKQEGRLDVSSNHPDGVESEYAILKPSCGGEISGTTLDDRLKPNTAWPHIYTTASPSTPNKTHFRGFDL